MKLRWYQQAAVEKAWQWIKENKGSPCIELPTGAGKSLVIAQLMIDVTKKWGGRAVLLAHRKELLEQTHEKLEAMSCDLDLGIYSAGLKRKDKNARCLLAGIQSVYAKACEIGSSDIILIDEAHLIPTEGEGMFRQFLKDMQTITPHCRFIGLTATPYRLREGFVCGPSHLLNEICYSVSVKELINQGFLSKLTSKATRTSLDVSNVTIRGGEFVQSSLNDNLSDRFKVRDACVEINASISDRNSVLIFATGREHGKMIVEELEAASGTTVAYVDGETDAATRAKTLQDFKDQRVRFLVNIDVLTTGFDATCVDCVVLLRPTLSPGLYYQMVGRGFRIDDRKENCLVLDFAGNVERHGPIDRIDIQAKQQGSGDGEAITKTCPECQELVHAAVRVCPDCQHEFPKPEIKHETQASNASIMSDERDVRTYNVTQVFYAKHTKEKESGTSTTLRVSYKIGPGKFVNEWICVEHSGYMRTKAEQWWQERSRADLPTTVDRAISLANQGLLANCVQISVDESAKFRTPFDHILEERPSLEGLSKNDLVEDVKKIFQAEEYFDDIPF